MGIRGDSGGSGGSGAMSDAQVKTAYENNANTNEFSDTEQAKLAGIATGAEVNIFSKLNAIIPPTVNNDVSEGYTQGSIWVDVTNDKSYICVDNAIGVAVWIEITSIGGGGSNKNQVFSYGGRDIVVDGTTTRQFSVFGNTQTLATYSGRNIHLKKLSIFFRFNTLISPEFMRFEIYLDDVATGLFVEFYQSDGGSSMKSSTGDIAVLFGQSLILKTTTDGAGTKRWQSSELEYSVD